MSDRRETVRRALEALHDLEDEMGDPDAWDESEPSPARAAAIERVKELQRKLREERPDLPHGL